MAVSIDWITGEITVPKADTVLVSAGPPEIRSFDLDQFRLDLRTAEAAADGDPWPRTHNHDTESLLSGFTYARKLEIISPYFVTFEDGQYVINLEGANHNILDVATANQVSLRAQNSAGLIKESGVPGKGVALNNFMFVMVLSSDHITPATGKTVTAQISKDAATPATTTNSPVEVGLGIYAIDLTPVEMDAEKVMLVFTEASSDDRFIEIVTAA